jgi:hypothetical protein
MNWGDINLVWVPTSLVGTWGIRSVITPMWGNHWVSLVCAAHDCEPQLSVQTKSALRKFKSIKPMQIVAKLLLLSFLDFAWEEALVPNFFALHFVVWKMEIGWVSNQLSKSAQNPDSHLSIILCYYRLNPKFLLQLFKDSPLVSNDQPLVPLLGEVCSVFKMSKVGRVLLAGTWTTKLSWVSGNQKNMNQVDMRSECV